MMENSGEALAIERLEALHREQGYILLAARSQFACGDIVPEMYGFDPAMKHKQPWIVESHATRQEFEAQFVHCNGRPIPTPSYGLTGYHYYRVRAAD